MKPEVIAEDLAYFIKESSNFSPSSNQFYLLFNTLRF